MNNPVKAAAAGGRAPAHHLNLAKKCRKCNYGNDDGFERVSCFSCEPCFANAVERQS